MTIRRFPPPWSIDESDACFTVSANVAANVAQRRPRPEYSPT
jgi:hypothetical protein